MNYKELFNFMQITMKILSDFIVFEYLFLYFCQFEIYACTFQTLGVYFALA